MITDIVVYSFMSFAGSKKVSMTRGMRMEMYMPSSLITSRGVSVDLPKSRVTIFLSTLYCLNCLKAYFQTIS